MGRQGKRAVFDPDVIVRARAVVDSVSYGDQTLAAVSVLMAEVLKLTGEQIGAVLGVSVPTVVRMNERFRKSETSESNNWGGVRHEVLPRDLECEVVAGLEDMAGKGQIVVARQLKLAIEERRGGSISLQTAYNILHRQGWRKVIPDKVHPKSDMEKQETFKKKNFRKRWLWLPPKHTQRSDRCG
jgi:transposase